MQKQVDREYALVKRDKAMTKLVRRRLQDKQEELITVHDCKKAAERERIAARRIAQEKESEQQKLLHDQKRFQATEQRNVRVLSHRINQGHQAEE